ncbi:MAG: Hydrogenase expression/formation protein HypE [Candidatus Moranbacteria bacterium GW2011_GWF2_34_56]|nr:MAG: Hydrogenase expression/formation protein HypE [Candidatus Moranbacteria bacterium GW2011_GWF1_34_10]KKP64567.1 MAG: Hydrogenase expression/formation protein HypE [Candidatus Moranbacteria bacterium GW2011_GWF2_34_56]HBI16661.1 hydrogenase expression/formation protein HypE [Candidatus Moranbacteria bacterium]
MEQYNNITLDMGGGGAKSAEIIKEIRKILGSTGKWKNTGDDGAVFPLNKDAMNRVSTEWDKLVFTTDSFIVDPIFFPGGDIGKIAICGTINDLAVMGARPIGIGLSLVIEEGFPMDDFKKIMKSIGKISKTTGVPIVTGDTKVTEKGKIDKIEITTSGVGLAQNIISNGGAKVGDYIISSGDLGEHAVALLASRFNYKTKIKSDCKPLNKELEKVGKFLNACKDPTRGGLAANLNEIADKSKIKIIVDEKNLPYKKEVVAVTELLGLDKFSLASEGRFIASVSPENIKKVLTILKKFNSEAKIIGRVEPSSAKAMAGKGVYVKTELGALRKIEAPKGKLIPRIC